MRTRTAPLLYTDPKGTSPFYRGRNRTAPVCALKKHGYAPFLLTVSTGDCATGGSAVTFEVEGDFDNSTQVRVFIGGMVQTLDFISPGTPGGTSSYIDIISPDFQDFEALYPGGVEQPPTYVPITVCNQYGYSCSLEVTNDPEGGYLFSDC